MKGGGEGGKGDREQKKRGRRTEGYESRSGCAPTGKGVSEFLVHELMGPLTKLFQLFLKHI